MAPVPIAEQEQEPAAANARDSSEQTTPTAGVQRRPTAAIQNSAASHSSASASSSSSSSSVLSEWTARVARLEQAVQRAFKAEPPGSDVSAADWVERSRDAESSSGRQLQRRLLTPLLPVCRCSDTQRKRELYRDTEIARMDFCEEAVVSDYLQSVSHAGDAARAAELEKSELGQQVRLLLADFDRLRAAFDLRHTMPKPSKTEMYIKMVQQQQQQQQQQPQQHSALSAAAPACAHSDALPPACVCLLEVVTLLYTLLSVIASLYLMPLRLLHPLLRRLGVKNHSLPIDLVQKHYCRGFLYLCGVEVSWDGLEAVDYARPVVGMFSHASNMDPMIVAAGPLAFKWIAKDSLFRIPLFGWTLSGWGHFAINRRSLQQAKLSLQHAARQIHRYSRCLAVSPEGTRSKTGLLQDFKKGPFHTAIAVGLPIVPIVIRGNFQLWPPNQLFPVSGRVVVSLLPAIVRLEGEGHAQLSSRVRRAMLQAIAQQPQQARHYSNSVVYVLWLPVTLALLAWSCSVVIRVISAYTA